MMNSLTISAKTLDVELQSPTRAPAVGNGLWRLLSLLSDIGGYLWEHPGQSAAAGGIFASAVVGAVVWAAWWS